MLVKLYTDAPLLLYAELQLSQSIPSFLFFCVPKDATLCHYFLTWVLPVYHDELSPEKKVMQIRS